MAPFPGATTGTGGRIRDVQATGRGAHVIAGTAGYSFGNLNIPGELMCMLVENMRACIQLNCLAQMVQACAVFALHLVICPWLVRMVVDVAKVMGPRMMLISSV